MKLAPRPAAADLDALELPGVGDIAPGGEAAALTQLGALKLRIAALEASLIARVLTRSSSKPSEGEDLTVEEAAVLLKMSKGFVRVEAKRRGWTVRTRGHRHVYRRQDVEAYLRGIVDTSADAGHNRNRR